MSATFFAELKRRNVIRMAGLYLVGAWLAVQVFATLLPVFEAPTWVMKAIVAAIVIGFVPMLIFSWIYELTPEGYKREGEVQIPEAVRYSTGRKLDFAIIGVLALAVVLLLADRFVLHRDAKATTSEAALDRSIAVLPFRNLSTDKDNGYFADALGEEIINSLARTPELRVSSRTASFAFRDSDKPTADIAAKLRVATLLEGSVQRNADKLRVTVQLIRAADGFELWSEDYDRTNNDVITVEEDVARSIAGALEIATDPQALAQMQRTGTRSVPAYQAYLNCLASYVKAKATGNFDIILDGIQAGHTATTIDPAFGDAYGATAMLEVVIAEPSAIKSPRAWAIPYGDLMRDLRADLDGAAANARTPVDRKKYQAILASLDVRLKDAIALMSDYVGANPQDRYAQVRLALWSTMIGDFARVRALAEAIARLDPTGIGSEPVFHMLYAHDARRAAELARQALAQEPDNVNLTYQAHRALLSVDATTDAARLLQRLLASRLPDAQKLMARIRQACAEGRTADAAAQYNSDEMTGDNTISSRWQLLVLLGRTDQAYHLIDRYDTPQDLYKLSTYMLWPMFDARRYPLLMKTLAAQGIEPPAPQPEPCACKSEAASP